MMKDLERSIFFILVGIIHGVLLMAALKILYPGWFV